jgi:hypothetical protein
MSSTRKPETLKRRRELQKERRQQKCELGSDVLEAMDEELRSVEDGYPKYADIARFFAFL